MTSTPRRRVVSVLAGTGFGGAERVACTLVRLAQSDGVQTTVEGAPGTREGLTAFGLTTCATESDLQSWTHAAKQRITDLSPTLVHVHLATPSMLGCALRVVGASPALLTFHLLPEGGWPLDRSYRLPSKLLLTLATRLRPNLFANTVSATDARLLRRLVPRHKLQSIINAPPLADVADAPNTSTSDVGVADTGASDVAWPGSGTRLLAVGRLVEQKGFDRLLSALASPRVRSLMWHLVVLGDGPERRQLAHLTELLQLQDRVSWVGAAAAPPWLRRAELVLSSSRYEGMPLVPLEAIREGTPILVSDIAPHRELFQPLASEAVLPAATEAWGAYLAPYVEDESRRKHLAQAQAALLPLCDPTRQWREYDALYTRILARR